MCDVAASELLMPRQCFEPDVADLGVSIDSVVRLGSRDKSSRQATAYRMLEFEKARPWAVAVLAYTLKPVERRHQYDLFLPGMESEPPPKLRFISVRSSTSGFPLVPKHINRLVIET